MGNIVAAIWSDEKFLSIEREAELDGDALTGALGQLLFIHICTRQHALPGLQVVGPSGLAESMRREHQFDQLRRSFNLLVKTGLVEYDAHLRITRVPGGPLYALPKNEDELRKLYQEWQRFPACELRTRHVESFRRVLKRRLDDADEDPEESERERRRHHWETAWDRTFGLQFPRVMPAPRLLSLPAVVVPLYPRGNPEVEDGVSLGVTPDTPDLSGEIGRERSGEGASEAPRSMATEAERLWAMQEQLRAKNFGAKRLPFGKRPRERIEKIFKLGFSVDDAEHVLRVYHAEAQAKRSLRYFDGTGNWKPDNFERALGKSIDDVSREAPRDARRGSAPPAPPEAFGTGDEARKVDLRR